MPIESIMPTGLAIPLPAMSGAIRRCFHRCRIPVRWTGLLQGMRTATCRASRHRPRQDHSICRQADCSIEQRRNPAVASSSDRRNCREHVGEGHIGIAFRDFADDGPPELVAFHDIGFVTADKTPISPSAISKPPRAKRAISPRHRLSCHSRGACPYRSRYHAR